MEEKNISQTQETIATLSARIQEITDDFPKAIENATLEGDDLTVKILLDALGSLTEARLKLSCADGPEEVIRKKYGYARQKSQRRGVM
jgi:DNA-binding ferritin-like protein